MRYEFNQEFYKLSQVQFEYYNEENLCKKISMSYDSVRNCWYYEGDINVIRYKYVINHLIRLNDPNANDYMIDDNGEVWSLSDIVDLEHEKSIELKNYSISNIVNHNMNRKEFFYGLMSEIFFNINLTGIRGVHSVTYICFQPSGQIFHLEEKSIDVAQNDFFEANIIFKSDISYVLLNDAVGMWCIQAYIDGQCRVKDFFTVKKKIINKLPYLDFQT